MDGLVQHCMPLAYCYLAHHKWACVTPTNYDDALAELHFEMFKSILSYKPEAGAKLMSWIYTNYRYRMMAFGRKEKPWEHDNVQLHEELVKVWIEPVS